MPFLKSPMLTLLAGWWLSGSLLALDLSGTPFESAARRYQLDPVLLYALALCESGYGGSHGVRPWAWALRSSRGSVYGKDRAEAEQVLSKWLKDGLLQRGHWPGANQSALAWPPGQAACGPAGPCDQSVRYQPEYFAGCYSLCVG